MRKREVCRRFGRKLNRTLFLVDFERPEQISKDEPDRFNVSHVANKPRLLVNISTSPRRTLVTILSYRLGANDDITSQDRWE